MLTHHRIITPHNGTKLKKNLTPKFQKKSYSRGMKCQPKANNNHEAVVVCARHVVKRPSKRMRSSKLLKRD